jgi:hypothetical protein
MPDEKWDPGRSKQPNEHLCRIIGSVAYESAQVNGFRNDLDDHESMEARTELDSHANMPVVGKNTLIVQELGETVDVNAFTPDYPAMKAKLIDAAVRYDCPFSGISHLLLIRNAIYVPAMKNNLIPPFIMREAGIKVNDCPKIHVNDPSVDDHAIIFEETGFRIPLSLWGVFSYFPTIKPTVDDHDSLDEVYSLTPSKWNPHSDVYARNEENMIDWEGNLTEKRDRRRLLIADIDEDRNMTSSLCISSTEAACNNEQVMQEDLLERTEILESNSPIEITSVASSISPLLCPGTLCSRLETRAEIGKFMQSIGATYASPSMYLVDDDDDESPDLMDTDTESSEGPSDDLEEEETLNETLDEILNGAKMGNIDLDAMMASAAHAFPRKDVDAAHLSKIWRIDIESAKRTLDITTQHRKHQAVPSLSRNYATNDRMLRYKRINEHFFMDTFFATRKAGESSRGHTCCQLFVTDKGFVYVVPMKSKSEVLQAVKEFTKEIGAPDAIIADPSGEQTSMALRKFCNEIGTTLRAIEAGTQWANRAELYIGLMKEAVRKDMKESNCPLVFWDYCVERRARINNVTAKGLFQLHGSNAHTATLHEEADISNISRYGWYEWCYFNEKRNRFPFMREVLGRVLGPARGEGNEMCQWVLRSNGTVVPRRSLRPLKPEEMRSAHELQKMTIFDALIERRHGTSINPPKKQTQVDETDDNEFEEYSDLDEEARKIPDTEDAVDSTGKLINQQPVYDAMLNAEVRMNVGNDVLCGHVKRRAVGPDGKLIGTYDENPILNTMVYEVEFPDGQVQEYSANLIAENMLSQVDDEGFSITMLEAIIDHQKDEANAVSTPDAYVVTRTGTRRRRKTTQGWKLLVKWKDGSETWIPLKDLKESNPVDVAEYAKARGIETEPAFAWWVPYTLRKRDIILSSVRSRVRKITHKYGIEMPVSVNHAIEIDRKNGNRFWQDAIGLEMVNVGVAFEVLDEDKPVPIGWRKVSGHLVFDVKMDFTRKARWVLDGHKTPDVLGSTYAGVVSRESVRIALTYAALNGLKICAADIRNAYLQAPSSQKDYVICGPEFGLENVGKPALIHRALYGGKTAGRDFRNHLRACMQQLGYSPCLADPDVWLRPAKQPDGTDCYEYVLLYVDDALAIGVEAENMLRGEIGRFFELKEDSIGPPKIYLGARMREVVLDNGVKAWGVSSSQYVQAAVKNVETYLSTIGQKLQAKADTPIQTSYSPELDVSTELDPKEASYYQSLIGILRWMVELGRIDICLEVSMLSSHLALPRKGHLTQVLHIFAYLRRHHNAELVLDPSDPVVNENDFERKDWASSEFGHITGKEELPLNMPEPKGFGFVMRCKVDADHAADTISRRSRTGFIVYLNSAPIYWMSKKQNSVESSSFGSEFIAMKQCCEYIRGLRYKLRMMGIPCEGPAYIYGDNQSVLANTSIPDSTLKKKSQSIAFHFVREGSARDEWRTTYVNTHDNEADLLTKVLPYGEKRKRFVRNLLHHLYDE